MAVVHATQAWLRSSWHVQVPFAWLEACVEWLQEEAGGAGRMSQQQINQQALDQWLLTDLRDLGHPVLPEGLSQAQETQLSGTFCVQVDSMLDISQPAYGQLQKWKGADCANEEVSAVTQATQRPWEARPTRMLLLQVTDGVQSLEAMEYQSVPALSTALRPGVKLQLQGQIVCRLGMLLLKPSNIKVLGGEVEDLVERNNQGRMLCRTLGLPEEQQQAGEDAPPARQQGNQEMEDLELDDAELLASLEAQEEVEMLRAGPVRDSGYQTLSETSTQSSRSSTARSLVSAASSRSGVTQRGDSVQGRHHGNDSGLLTQQEIPDQSPAGEDFPDEDFDDLPLDELDGAIFQGSANVAPHPDSSHSSTPQNNHRMRGNSVTKAQTAQYEQHTLNVSETRLGLSCSRSSAQKRDYQGCTKGTAAASEPSRELEFVTNDDIDFMDEDMDCFLTEVETMSPAGPNRLPVHQGPSRDRENTETCRLNCNSSSIDRPSAKKESERSAPALTLTSPPFTYLCLLEEMMSKPQPHTTEIRVKAFIVTLLGKLSSSNGVWRVCATISDGTGYLDVELSNEVLTGLLGFSVTEKGALKRDPAQRSRLDAGMRRCQEELVDMCCVMTIVVEPGAKKAVVTKADPVNEKVVQELEQRVRGRIK